MATKKINELPICEDMNQLNKLVCLDKENNVKLAAVDMIAREPIAVWEEVEWYEHGWYGCRLNTSDVLSMIQSGGGFLHVIVLFYDGIQKIVKDFKFLLNTDILVGEENVLGYVCDRIIAPRDETYYIFDVMGRMETATIPLSVNEAEIVNIQSNPDVVISFSLVAESLFGYTGDMLPAIQDMFPNGFVSHVVFEPAKNFNNNNLTQEEQVD